MNNKANYAPQRGTDRIETLAREVFAQMMRNGNTGGYEIKHIARLAQDAAAAFYETWDEPRK